MINYLLRDSVADKHRDEEKNVNSQERVTRLTVEQLAIRWQKSDDWIRSNYRRIGLKVLPIGQQLRFPIEEVEAWEQSQLR